VGENIPKEHKTIGEAFRDSGYETFGSGKWHNGSESFARSFSSGDDIFFGGMADHWNVPAYSFDPYEKYDRISPQTLNYFYSNKRKNWQCDHVHAGVHSSELIADAGIRFIDNCKKEKPFLAYLSFLAPHDPRTMPEEFLEMYPAGSVDMPLNFLRKHPFDNGALELRDEKLAEFPREQEEIKRHITEYFAMITHLDFHIGRVLEKLEETKLLEDTIIVLAGDNGLAVGQHGLMGKQNCYEHSVRVPLIFSGPGIPRGVQTKANAYLFDVFPTLCELADIKKPESSEGLSLSGAMSNANDSFRESLFLAYCETQRAVKRGGYKLIEYVVNGAHTKTQLFDLKNDNWEMRNMAYEKGYQGKVDELRLELRNLGDEWGDKKTRWGKTFWEGFGNAGKINI
jgi:arylsulfatase A-like enzyme